MLIFLNKRCILIVIGGTNYKCLYARLQAYGKMIRKLRQFRKERVIMLEKNYILKSGLFLFLACLFLMPSIYAQAAVKKLDILNGENRKSCQVDLDGDGVKEKLKLAVKYDEYGCIENASVYVNGKKALVIKSSYDYSVGADYLKMSGPDIFVRIYTIGASDIHGSDYIYRYDPSRKKLVKETKLLNMNEGASGASVKTVTGEEIKILYSHQLDKIGRVSWTGAYAVKDGRLKLKPGAYKVKNTTTTEYGDPDGYGKLLEKNQYKCMADDLLLYKDTDMQAESYLVHKDDIITLKKIKYTKDEWFVQFEKDGKIGWLGLNDLGSRELFYGVSSRTVS